MKFRIVAMLSVILVVVALGLGCSKGKKKDKKAAAPAPATSPVSDANKQVISPQRAAELAKNLDETSAILKQLASPTPQ